MKPRVWAEFHPGLEWSKDLEVGDEVISAEYFPGMGEDNGGWVICIAHEVSVDDEEWGR